MPTIQNKRGTAADITAVNPIPADGELLYETDTNRMKVGDGVTRYNALPYLKSAASDITSGTVAPARLGSGTASATTFLRGDGAWDASPVTLPATGITITKTGDWFPADGMHPQVFVVPPLAVQFENTYVRYGGKWISSFSYSESLPTGAPGRLTSLTFSDLEGTTGDFRVATMAAFTTLSAPVLRYVGGQFVVGTNSFNIPGLPLITTVSVPELKYVGGGISCGSVAALTALSFPELIFVNGDFAPGVAGGIPVGMAALTTLSVPNLRFAGSVAASNLAVLATLSFPALVSTRNQFAPANIPALTTLSIPELSYVGGTFSPNIMNSLTTLSAPKLSYVHATFQPSQMNNLTTLSIPVLSYVGVFSPQTLPALTELSAPNLTTCGSGFTPNGMNALTTFSFPSLVSIGTSMSFVSFASLTSISFPALTSVGNATGTSITISSVAALTTLSLPSLATITGGSVSIAAAALANVTLPTNGTFKNGGTTFTISGAALTQTSVNNILQAYASLDGTNGTTSWVNTLNVSGGTSAAPSNLGSTTTPGSQFVCAGTTCTVNWTGHGYATGDVLRISGITTATNANRYARITVVNANQFTYTITSQTATGAGTATVVKAGASANALVTRGVTLTTN